MATDRRPGASNEGGEWLSELAASFFASRWVDSTILWPLITFEGGYGRGSQGDARGHLLTNRLELGGFIGPHHGEVLLRLEERHQGRRGGRRARRTLPQAVDAAFQPSRASALFRDRCEGRRDRCQQRTDSRPVPAEIAAAALKVMFPCIFRFAARTVELCQDFAPGGVEMKQVFNDLPFAKLTDLAEGRLSSDEGAAASLQRRSDRSRFARHAERRGVGRFGPSAGLRMRGRRDRVGGRVSRAELNEQCEFRLPLVPVRSYRLRRRLADTEVEISSWGHKPTRRAGPVVRLVHELLS